MKMYTHAGVFHADEVAAYAILSEIFETLELVRLQNINEIPDDGIVVDIGREHNPDNLQFDHHQSFLQRRNGYPYASCGLVWQKYGAQVIQYFYPHADSEFIRNVAIRVDERLIQGIDAHDADNSYKAVAQCTAGEVSVKTLSNVISAYNFENIHNAAIQHEQFQQAAKLFNLTLRSEIKQAAKFFDTLVKFEDIADFTETGKIVILDKHLPWREIVHEYFPNVLFAIVPSSHPGAPWSLIARSVAPNSRELMQPIERPKWFDGFIHQGKWIAGCKNVKEAVSLALHNL